jgi:hypothetical protein
MFTNIIESINSLCKPAYIYFMFSVITFLFYVLYLIFNTNKIKDDSLVSIFFRIIFVLVFTYILHVLCKNGYETLSWILLILPLFTFFVIFVVLFLFFKFKHVSQSLYQN